MKTELTDEQKQELRVKIAEIHTGIRYVYRGTWYMIGDDGDRTPFSVVPPKDYLNDLNAMREAENLLTDDQHKVFRQRLWALTNLESPKWGDDDWNRAYASATATQRARAFLMTMEGKV